MQENKRDIESIFLAALEKTIAGGSRCLFARACDQDVEFRQKVERLLDAHHKAVDFLEMPAGQVAETVKAAVIGEGPGTVIGRYKSSSKSVKGLRRRWPSWPGSSNPIRRKVAAENHQTGPGYEGSHCPLRSGTSRPWRLMDHPNVAAFSTPGPLVGRPYFVMELVRGIPITEYCDKNNLTPSERIDLFVSVCNAVQHAHQKGIIHRDIKPSNVLITLHDGKPIVKIIDFGISRAINQRLTERTLFTKFDQMISTPRT